MEKELEILNDIHQGVEMGVIAIEAVLDKAEDSAFRSAIMRQMNTYQDFLTQTETLLRARQTEPKDVGEMAKMMLRANTGAKLMKDASTSHMAEMMMEGHYQVVIQMTRELKNAQQAAPEVLSLAQQYLQNAEDDVQAMKAFL